MCCEAWPNQGRADEIALYTGNDDSILVDLLTEYSVSDVSLADRRWTAGPLGSLDTQGGRAARVRSEAAREPVRRIPPEC
jgi:hypothetical protein